MLAAVFNPSHRMPDPHRNGGDRDVLRHKPVLATESAPDVGRDDTHLVFRQAEHLRQAEPLHLSALGRQVDDEFVGAVIPVGNHAAAFERNSRLPVHSKLPAQAHGRRGQRTGIALDHGAGDVGVVRPVIEDARAAGVHGCDAVHDRR